MKQIITIVFWLHATTGYLHAQKENNNWAFGFHAGLDFNSGSPVAVRTNIGSGGNFNYEGCATISDRYTGQLLFYSQGGAVWDRNHNIMPNGHNLSTDPSVWSSSQSALIVPILNTPDQYYLFSLGQTATSTAHGLLPNSAMLSYSVIDMKLNGGLGDVVPGRKNIHMDSVLSEQMIAVAGNNCNIWLLVHNKSNVFKAYEITTNGTIHPPVLSAVGAGHPAGNNPGEAATQMKVAPNGRKLSAAYRYHNRPGFYAAELYDFDPATGVVSNPLGLQFLNTNRSIYGTCFSPDNSKVYFQEAGAGVRIYQFDLNAGTPAAIQASQTVVGTNNNLGGDMQLGPDGKVYAASVAAGSSGFLIRGFLHSIDAPNQAGVACLYQSTPVVLIPPDSSSYGLPNRVVYPKQDTVTYINHICEPMDSVRISVPQGFFFHEWYNGRTDSSQVVRQQGVYWVRSVNSCMVRIDTFVIIPSPQQIDIGPDIIGCEGDVISLQVPVTLAGASYRWSTGETTSVIQVNSSGIYSLRVDILGCAVTDTVEVILRPAPVADLGKDTGICHTDTPFVLKNADLYAGAQYLWSNGLSEDQMKVVRTGTYWLRLSENGCEDSDTVVIRVITTPVVHIGNDSIICEQFPLRIGARVPEALYTWNTGQVTSHIDVAATGHYILEVNLGGCIVHDTVQITAMPAPEIDLGGDRDICPEQTVVLDGGYGTNSKYRWNTGDTTSSVAATAAGFYQVYVTTEHHCMGTDSVMLSFYPKPVVHLGADTTVCEETPLMIGTFRLNTDSVVWSDGSVGNSLSVRYGGRYIATGINKCGARSDTIDVKQMFCDIWAPNVFTPNGDGRNDVFRALGNIGRLEGFGLSIYNRWGQLVFHTKDKLQGWDGYYNGSPALMGTYVYMLEYTIGNKPYLQKGNFHLLR